MDDKTEKTSPNSKTLFVRNLPYSITNELLEEAFQEYGPIKSCFVVKDSSNKKSKGFGYVIFSVREDSEKAQKCVEKIGNRKVHIDFAKPKERKKKDKKKPAGDSPAEPKDEADAEETKVIPEEETEKTSKEKKGRDSNTQFTLVVTGFDTKHKDGISRLTSCCENIVDTTYPAPDRETPTALMKFSTKIDAINAIRKINKQRTGKHPVKAIFSYQEGRTPKQISPKLCKLIVRNISFRCKEKDLEESFGKFGTITEVKIPLKPDGKMFGYGFVQFSSLAEAKEAMSQMNAKPILGRPVAVDWALAREKYQEAMGKKAPTAKQAETSTGDKKSEEKTKSKNKNKQDKESSVQPSTDSEEEDESSGEDDELSEEADKSSGEDESSEGGDKSNEEDEESSEEEDESEEKLQDSGKKRVKVKESEKDMSNDDDDMESDDDDDDDEDMEGEEDSDKDSDDSDMDSDEDDEGFSDGSSDDEKKTKKPKKKEAPRPDDVGEGKTLFIRNVSFDSEEDDLEELLSQYGEIKYCRLVIDKQTEHSKGVAFVQFVNKEDADKCIVMSDDEQLKPGGIALDGRRLKISLAVSRNEAAKLKIKPDKEDEKKDKRNLWLLREGLIRPGTGAAKGLSKEDLHRREQVEKIKRQKLKNPDIFVSPTRLCVRNIPTSVSDHQLKKVFLKAAGDRSAVVKENRIMRDMNRLNAAGRGKPRGYGFVEFEDHKHALAALRETNNNPELFGEKKRLIVEFSLENRSALRTKQERVERSKAKQEMLKRNTGQAPNKQMRGTRKITVGSVQAPPKGVDTKKIPRGMPSHMGPKIRHKPRAPAPEPKKPKDAVSRKVAQANKAKRKSENTLKEPSTKKKKGGQMRTDDIDKLVAKYRNTFKQAAVKKQSQKWFETS